MTSLRKYGTNSISLDDGTQVIEEIAVDAVASITPIITAPTITLLNTGLYYNPIPPYNVIISDPVLRNTNVVITSRTWILRNLDTDTVVIESTDTTNMTTFTIDDTLIDVGVTYTLEVYYTSVNIDGDRAIMQLVGGTNELTGIFTHYATPPLLHRYRHAQVTLDDGRIFVCGGVDQMVDVGIVITSAVIYDPTTNVWISVADMPAGIREHTISLLGNGDVIVVGGTLNNWVRNRTVYIYSPATDVWTRVADFPHDIRFHTQSTLSNGHEIMVSRGYTDGVVSQAAHIYDTITGVWRRVTDVPMVGNHGVQATLSDGDILIGSGWGGTTSSITMYRYNVALDTYTLINAAPSSMIRALPTTLLNGNLYILIIYSTATRTYEYNPVTDTYTIVNNFPILLSGSTYSRLKDGRVIVIGGAYTDTDILRTELTIIS